MGLSQGSFTVEELGSLGVRRVSVGSSLSRAAYGAFLSAAQEIYQKGTFSFAQTATPHADFNELFRAQKSHE
jgi:2-methylisocitrate lyase-like PEP mutase family enzyme